MVSETHKQIRRQTDRQTDRDRETDGRTDRQTDTCASSSMGVNATGDAGDTSPTILGQPGTKHLIPPHKVCPVSTRETARQLTSLTVGLHVYEHGAVLRLTQTRTGKTLSINQNCRHFRMNFRLNPVPLVLHRLRRDSRRSLWGQRCRTIKRDSLIP